MLPPHFVGEVSQDELDAVNSKLNNLRDFIDTLVTRLNASESNQAKLIAQDKMIRDLLDRITVFETRLNQQDAIIGKNTKTIRGLEEQFGLLQSQFDKLFNELGAKLGELGNIDWSNALGALEA